MSNLTNALIITGIGMGLVFIAIILLWWLMALMVRLFPEKEEASEAVDAAVTAQADVEPAAESGVNITRALAAAAAVAVALALRARDSESAQRPGDASFNAWQTARRATRLSRQSSMYSRKS